MARLLHQHPEVEGWCFKLEDEVEGWGCRGRPRGGDAVFLHVWHHSNRCSRCEDIERVEALARDLTEEKWEKNYACHDTEKAPQGRPEVSHAILREPELPPVLCKVVESAVFPPPCLQAGPSSSRA